MKLVKIQHCRATVIPDNHTFLEMEVGISPVPCVQISDVRCWKSDVGYLKSPRKAFFCRKMLARVGYFFTPRGFAQISHRLARITDFFRCVHNP